MKSTTFFQMATMKPLICDSCGEKIKLQMGLDPYTKTFKCWACFTSLTASRTSLTICPEFREQRKLVKLYLFEKYLAREGLSQEYFDVEIKDIFLNVHAKSSMSKAEINLRQEEVIENIGNQMVSNLEAVELEMWISANSMAEYNDLSTLETRYEGKMSEMGLGIAVDNLW